MSNAQTQSPPHAGAGADMLDPARNPALFSGILSRRAFAFVLDAAAILLLSAVGWVLMLVLGVFTFGLLWLAMGLVFPVVALCYTGFSLGGPASATPGMRAMGLEMRQGDGAPMFTLLAMAHALIFWFSIAGLTPLILLVALFNSRRKLAHDFLLGTVVINSGLARRIPAAS